MLLSRMLRYNQRIQSNKAQDANDVLEIETSKQ